MRNSTAYFAGVATVFAATALGFGGAMILTSATTPRSPAEPTKLQRSVAPLAQASPSADTKTPTTTEANATSPAPPRPPQPASLPSEPVQSASTTPQTPASTQQPFTAPGQSVTDAQAKAPANAFARGSDDNVRKYIRKRERRWAHRHYRNDHATTSAQVSNSTDPNASQPTASAHSSSDSATPPAAQEQAQPGPTQTRDQTTSRADDSDTRKVKRKHERRWTRSYARDDDERADGQRSLEVREMPPQDAPQPFFGVPRWRPVFDDGDD